MYIVIGGEGEIALRLAAELMSEHEVVLVLPDAESEASTAALDVATIHGELASSGVLRQAGVPRAQLFVACSKDDEDNLVACVAAKRLGAKSTTCFLFRPDHRSRPGEDLGLAELMGIDRVVRPAQQLASEMVRIASVPGALDVEVFEDGRIRLLRHHIDAGTALTKGALMEIELPRDVVFVMGRRGDEIFVPTGRTRFEAGDKVTVMGSRKGLARLVDKFLRAPDQDRDDRTATVVGGGTVGVAVARGLANVGWNVKIIEPNRERCEAIAPLVKGLVLHGDGSDISLLEEEQVGGDGDGSNHSALFRAPCR
jgi:trk system potassium uptake protein TrkA